MKNFSVDKESEENKTNDTVDLLSEKSLWDKFLDKLSYVFTFEFAILFSFVVVAFSLAVNHFMGGSVQSLVPLSSVSSCDTYSEVFSLAPQAVKVEEHFLFVITTVHNGQTNPGYALVNFTGQWSSCLRQSVDNNFHLNPESDVNYEPLALVPQEFAGGFVNASSSSNDGCFQLYCNFQYTYQVAINKRHDYESYLNNSIFVNIPYNINDGLELDDDGLSVANSQLIASIAGTDNSVTAGCSMSIAGYYVEILSVSNSVTSTGTYLCTQYTTTFQAVTSAIAIALTAIGLCRLYLGIKAYVAMINSE